MFTRRSDLAKHQQQPVECSICKRTVRCHWGVIAGDTDAHGNYLDKGRTHWDVLMSYCDLCKIIVNQEPFVSAMLKAYADWLKHNPVNPE
jgi:hypothetical protein